MCVQGGGGRWGELGAHSLRFMCVCMDECVHLCMDGCVCVCVRACVDVFVYACACVYDCVGICREEEQFNSRLILGITLV